MLWTWVGVPYRILIVENIFLIFGLKKKYINSFFKIFKDGVFFGYFAFSIHVIWNIFLIHLLIFDFIRFFIVVFNCFLVHISQARLFSFNIRLLFKSFFERFAMNFNRHALSPVEILSNIHRVPLILSFFLRTFTLANAHTGATQPYLNVVLVLSSQSTLVPVIRDITEMWQNSQSKNSEENWKVQGKNILVSRVLFLKRREFKRSMNHDLFFLLCIYVFLWIPRYSKNLVDEIDRSWFFHSIELFDVTFLVWKIWSNNKFNF